MEKISGIIERKKQIDITGKTPMFCFYLKREDKSHTILAIGSMDCIYPALSILALLEKGDSVIFSIKYDKEYHSKLEIVSSPQLDWDLNMFIGEYINVLDDKPVPVYIENSKPMPVVVKNTVPIYMGEGALSVEVVNNPTVYVENAEHMGNPDQIGQAVARYLR